MSEQFPTRRAKRLNDSKRLESLRQYGIVDTPADPLFDEIAATAAAVCNTPVALISLVEGHRQWFKAKVGVDMTQTSIDQSICAKAIEYDGLFEVRDASVDPRVNSNPLVYGEPHISFYAGAPLLDPEGRPLGMVCVIDLVPRPQGLLPDQAETLEKLAQKIMDLLDERRKTLLAQK